MHDEKIQPYPADVLTRFWALALDGLLLLLPIWAIASVLPYLGPMLIVFLYRAVFEASRVQATPGKRALNLIVQKSGGGRISFGTSLLRCALSTLSLSCFGLGHWVAVISHRRRALHDLICDSEVVEGSVGDDLWTAWADELRSAFRQTASSTSERTSGGSSLREDEARLALLEKLQELKEKGAISPEEYETEKRRVLRK